MAALICLPVITVSFASWVYMLQHSSSKSSQHISNSTVVSTSASGYNDGQKVSMDRAELLLMPPRVFVNIPLGKRGFKLGIQCSKYGSAWCRPLLPTMWPVKHGNDPTQQSNALARAGASNGLHTYMSMNSGL